MKKIILRIVFLSILVLAVGLLFWKSKNAIVYLCLLIVPVLFYHLRVVVLRRIKQRNTGGDPINKRDAFISTLSIAFSLALLWTVAWLLVFAFATTLLNLKTDGISFVFTLWVSVMAEAAIRYFENHNSFAKFAEPYNRDAKGQNVEYTLGYAIFLVFLGFGVMGGVVVFYYVMGITYGDLVKQTGVIHGQGEIRSPETFNDMVLNWWDVISSSVVYKSILAAIVLRTLIYKRSHKHP